MLGCDVVESVLKTVSEAGLVCECFGCSLAFRVVVVGAVAFDFEDCRDKSVSCSVFERQDPKASITESHFDPQIQCLEIAIVKLIELTVAKETFVKGFGGDLVDLSCEGFSLFGREHRDDMLER